MSVLRYRPASSGGWLIVADGHRAFVVGPSGWELADDAAAAIGGDLGFEATIDIVTRAGFASIPDFVLIEWTGDTLRSLLRGPVTLSVTDGAGEHTQDGSGISTWTERSFSGATSARATIDGASYAAGIDALALRSGVAFLESCALDFSEADRPPHPSSASVPAPAPVLLTRHRTPAPVPPTRHPAPDVSETIPPPVSEAIPPPVSEARVSSIPEEHAGPSTDTIVSTATPVAGIDGPGIEGRGIEGRGIEGPAADGAGTDGSGAGGAGSARLGTDASELGGPTDATIVGSPSDRSPFSEDAPPDVTASDRVGDHDGNTILSSDIAKLRSARGSKSPGPSTMLSPEPVPSMFLALPDGTREKLDQPLLIGRSPSVSKVSGDRMPRLITVGGGDQDISRNHARFAVEGGTVVVTDLHSRNGTLVVLPGKSPQKLRAGEPTSVIVGTVVDLGGGITLTVGVE